jgi:mRNA interferase MazF
MNHYKQFDVVVVPFPFTDKIETKKRPAVIISTSKWNSNEGHVIAMMITSAKNSSWTGDIEVSDLKASGLPAPSILRLKIFTLDCKLILNKIGVLSLKDQKNLCKMLKSVIPI